MIVGICARHFAIIRIRSHSSAQDAPDLGPLKDNMTQTIGDMPVQEDPAECRNGAGRAWARVLANRLVTLASPKQHYFRLFHPIGECSRVT